MVNWLSQAQEWISTALPIWGEVLEYITQYSFLDLLDDVLLKPLAPLVGVIAPGLLVILEGVVDALNGTTADVPIVQWLLMMSAPVVFIYLAVSFVKWIIGIIT